MADPIIIGLTGQKRSGKDSFARALCWHVDYGDGRPFARHLNQMAETVSFGGPIRQFVADLLGMTLDDLERIKELPDRFGVTPRHMMQTLGTEWGRQMVHPDLWVMVCLQKIKNAASRGRSLIVISDVRFLNEATSIKELGGKIVRIERPGLPPPDGHESERPLADYLIDYRVSNDCTLQALSDSAGELLAAIKGARNG